MDSEPPSSREDFQIGIVCALPLEFDAVVASLDQIWDEDVCGALGKAPGDANTYTHGRMKQHNVVVALLRQRGGKPTMGKANAAIVASDLRHSYFGLNLALLVGICGGVPKAGGKDMLLGDVVIGSSVVQYDFGRQFPDGFRRKQGPQNSLAAPMAENASILGILDTGHGKETVRVKTASFLAAMQQTHSEYAFPGAASDKLYEASYRHKHQNARDCQCQNHEKETDAVCEGALEGSCEALGCSDDFLVKRSRLEQRLAATADDKSVFEPAIFVGAVATGDTVMKSGVARDAVAEAENIIGFEMEAAGLVEQLPTIIIKSVCDYADSHKNKKWQTYAAGTAAAAAKAVVMFHTPADRPRVREMKAAQPESILPFPPDPEFLSRPEISDWIGEKARTPGARAALVGFGGIGKSQLAIRYAHGVRNRSHVFWVNATTLATLEESIRAISERLNLEKPGDSRDDIFRRVGSWLGREQNGAWTVVLDNFDDDSILAEDDPRLQKLLPQSSNGFLLVTSRTTKAAERLTGSGKNVIYLVPELGEEAALELFQTKLENPCEKEVAQEVVRLLDFMPLSISQAAAYINNRADQVSLRDYADMFQAGDEKRKALLEWEYDEVRRYHSSNSVLGTWAITLEQMQREKPSAVDLLSLMCFFSPQSIPEWALEPLYMDSIERHLPKLTMRDIVPSSVTSALSRVELGRRALNQTWMRDLHTEIHNTAWSLWTTRDMGGEKKPAKHDAKHLERAEAGQSKKKNRRSAMARLAGKAIGAFDPRTSPPPPRDDAAERLGQDLDMLRKYLMVTPTAEEGVLKMHPLVRYSTQHWLSQSKVLDVWKKRFLMIMVVCLESPPPEHEWHKSDTSDVHRHIEFLIDENPEDAPTARLWNIVCTHLLARWQRRGSKDPAVILALREKMAAVADKFLGPGDRVTLANRMWLANYALEQGEFEKAENMFRDVICQASDVQGGESKEAIQSRFQWVKAVRAQGQLDKAEQETESLRLRVTNDPGFRRFLERARQIIDGEMLGAVVSAKFTGCSIIANAEVVAALGDTKRGAELALQVLEDSGLMFWAAFEELTASLAGLTKTLSMDALPDEMVPLLFKILSHLEPIPEMWWQFPFIVCPPFHRHLAICLDRQGDAAGADLVVEKGIRQLASAWPLPELEPPGLANSLIEAPADDEGTRRRLLQEVIQGLDSEDGRFDFYFLARMANIGRHLFVQGRTIECESLLNAICQHMVAEWGEKHEHTKIVARFRDDMATWIAGKRTALWEPELGREAWRVAEEEVLKKAEEEARRAAQERADSSVDVAPEAAEAKGAVSVAVEEASAADGEGGKAMKGGRLWRRLRAK